MKDILKFIFENYKTIILIVSLVVEIVFGLVLFFKKQKKPVIAALLAALPDFIVKGEATGLKGKEKLDFVVKLAVGYLATLIGCKDDQISPNLKLEIEQSIESILETPQKKGIK